MWCNVTRIRHLLADDPAYADRAKRFAARVSRYNRVSGFELSDTNELATGAPIEERVTVRRTVSFVRTRNVSSIARFEHSMQCRPQLRSVTRIRAVLRIGWDFSPHASGNRIDVLDEKLEQSATRTPNILVTANPGCQMQIQSGARMAGMNLRVLHIVELIDESYDREGLYR